MSAFIAVYTDSSGIRSCCSHKSIAVWASKHSQKFYSIAYSNVSSGNVEEMHGYGVHLFHSTPNLVYKHCFEEE